MIEMKIQNNIPKKLVFFDFPKPLKNNKDEIFEALKHFKNLFLKSENGEIFALKILAKIPKKRGLYRPKPETSR